MSWRGVVCRMPCAVSLLTKSGVLFKKNAVLFASRAYHAYFIIPMSFVSISQSQHQIRPSLRGRVSGISLIHPVHFQKLEKRGRGRVLAGIRKEIHPCSVTFRRPSNKYVRQLGSDVVVVFVRSFVRSTETNTSYSLFSFRLRPFFLVAYGVPRW